MSVDVEIYISNLQKFFRENPDELLSLIPHSKEDEFFEKVREVAFYNFENGDDVSLTRQQLITICVELNGKLQHTTQNIEKIIIQTAFGEYSLN